MSKEEIAELVLNAIRDMVESCENFGLEKIHIDSLKRLLALQGQYEAEESGRRNDQPRETT